MIWVHLTILSITVLGIAFTDIYGLLWVLGKKETLDIKILRRMHLFVWAGLLGMIATGIYMILPSAGAYWGLELFKWKMLFVIILCINAWFIGKHMEIAGSTSWKNVSVKTKRTLVISGLASTGSWTAAFVLAKTLFGW